LKLGPALILTQNLYFEIDSIHRFKIIFWAKFQPLLALRPAGCVEGLVLNLNFPLLAAGTGIFFSFQSDTVASHKIVLRCYS
jgi:hypothetical protein